MKKRGRWLCAAAAAACVAVAAPAGAATVKASFGVSVTVVSSCRIVAGSATGCETAAPTGPAATPTPQPLVTYSHDAKTGGDD